mmetsp:Transcript_24480/g.59395  ORF Transcript_24480/g.59395 Transcript_24480/m.59395 type:complete len:208 (+) Transcript_24480:869-1492(+)
MDLLDHPHVLRARVRLQNGSIHNGVGLHRDSRVSDELKCFPDTAIHGKGFHHAAQRDVADVNLLLYQPFPPPSDGNYVPTFAASPNNPACRVATNPAGDTTQGLEGGQPINHQIPAGDSQSRFGQGAQHDFINCDVIEQLQGVLHLRCSGGCGQCFEHPCRGKLVRLDTGNPAVNELQNVSARVARGTYHFIKQRRGGRKAIRSHLL